MKNFRSIQDNIHWLKRVSEGKERFDEAKVWPVFESILPKDQHHFTKKEYAQLFAMLALARFKRVNKLDPLVKQWMKEASKGDESNELLHELRVESLLSLLQQIKEKINFTPMRETDHELAKKELAQTYYKTAKKIVRDINHFNVQWEKSFRSIEQLNRTNQVKVLKNSVSILHKIENTVVQLQRATEQYAHSITNVYYSKSQFETIQNELQKIESFMQQWEKVCVQTNKVKKKNNEALDELEQMIGLHSIKERIEKLYQFLHYQKERHKKGFHFEGHMNLHMILTGNPGTGKTHLARLIAKIYYELGILEKNNVYEVNRTQLVGAYVGHTEENTIQAIERAKGGVLFIDEAYSLHREGSSGNDYGQTVIDTLVAAMTDDTYANTFALILAGYPHEMRTFLRSNPGLRSRFPEHNQFHIDNYSIDELLEIGEQYALQNDYYLSPQAKVAFKKRIEQKQVDQSFGNARTVKNIIFDAIFQKGSQLQIHTAKEQDYVLLEHTHFQDDAARENVKKDSFNDLIGLTHIKKAMSDLISFVVIQQKRRENELPIVPLHLHAIFKGNPGTGKTTVARLYSQALKDAGLLKRGHMVEVSRADLVAPFVGQTAERTKEKIQDALGGVLFIDEAYSLFSTSENDFGKEAISTLVQQMTEHEENIVVILAGYEREMDLLLNSNPGLRSRFKKQFTFNDYTKDELVDIILERANQYNYYFSDRAKQTLKKHVTADEGNGRYAVDLFQRLVQQQSLRLKNVQTVTKDELQKITVHDINKVFSKGE